MAEWLFWWTLAAMLWTGHRFGTGVFLSQFSLAALFAGATAIVFPGSLEGQLQFFLFLACLQILVVRRRPGTRHRPHRR